MEPIFVDFTQRARYSKFQKVLFKIGGTFFLVSGIYFVVSSIFKNQPEGLPLWLGIFEMALGAIWLLNPIVDRKMNNYLKINDEAIEFKLWWLRRAKRCQWRDIKSIKIKPIQIEIEETENPQKKINLNLYSVPYADLRMLKETLTGYMREKGIEGG
ncbi:MAG: hypothetical protein M1470_10770 [Bacteroidetes bacterium]|nr:hypothetical protein [Bacteroidota bacterium]MCL5738934.1 hypothetical protein [Bacteroidota bacterium]